MPALTISTENPKRSSSRSRSASPARPPVSPITPTLAPVRPAVHHAPPDRPLLTHSQPDQTAIPAPAPQPIAFDSNPDVIALKSAISILQMQRQKATADIQVLNRAKEEAVHDPEAFIRDLSAGKVNSPSRGFQNDDSDDSDDDAGEGPSKKSSEQQPPPAAWATLPTPQNIVRCPPINWSQYAVVGDSLEKLHSEQVNRPSQGTPAVVGANGMYEFTAGQGRQEKYPGVAAPYNPLHDKIDKKSRGKR